MKPICADCKLFFRPKRNGVWFEEGMPVTQEDGSKVWQSYKLWNGDLWECRGCGAQIISGVGQNPIREHWEPDYTEVLQRLGSEFRVDDC